MIDQKLKKKALIEYLRYLCQRDGIASIAGDLGVTQMLVRDMAKGRFCVDGLASALKMGDFEQVGQDVRLLGVAGNLLFTCEV